MVVMGGHTFIRDDKLNFRTLRLFKGFGVGAPFFFIWDPHSIYIVGGVYLMFFIQLNSRMYNLMQFCYDIPLCFRTSHGCTGWPHFYSGR
jgi:hypothetical protein